MLTDPYLELLAAVGIHIDPAEWNAAHPLWSEPRGPTKLPTHPIGFDEDAYPIFSRSQIDECAPEVFGFDTYTVVEDPDAAHPYALNYEDELHWYRWHRPIHRYSRPYRIRRALAHVVGCCGPLPPPEIQEALRADLDENALRSRGVYNSVRALLKKGRHTRFYASIPYIITQLGGPHWKVSTEQYARVLEDAIQLHRLFEFRKPDLHGRLRFPKIQFVLLRLLDRHRVAAPYNVPWARTFIKRRQLCGLVTQLESQPAYVEHEQT